MTDKHDEKAADDDSQAAFQEIELKLTGTARSLSSLFEALGGGAVRSALVRSTYYDTADRRLWARGFTFRLRDRLRERGDAYELTLKHQDGGALARGEWSTMMPEPVVDLALLPREAPRSRIGTILPEELLPLFTTEFDRKRKQLDLAGATVEVALDTGRIVNDEHEAPLVELELELLSGALAPMLRHFKATLRGRRFVIGTRTKSDRGMELADGTPPPVIKAEKPSLVTADSIDTALAKMISANAAQIIGNIAAAVDGRNPEGVHQFRVGLRRLRSAFALFNGHLTRRAEILDEAAKRAFKALSEARDLDVFLLETMPPVTEGHPDSAALPRLSVCAEQGRQAAYQTVRDLTAERWFNSFLFDLLLAGEVGGLIRRDRNEPLQPLAAAVLKKRHKKVMKLGRDFAGLAPPERHEVRLALKKLRYACDDLRGLFPKKLTKPYIKSLSTLQDDLGQLNDATVAGAIADRLGADDPVATIGAALVKGWYGHRLKHVEPHMRQAWRRFAHAKPFWRS